MTNIDEKCIPAFSAPNDIIRCGFRSLAYETISTHPIHKLQENLKIECNSNLDIVRRSYGSAFAMRLASEKSTHMTGNRLFGLNSSRIAHDTVTGTDSSINFNEILNGSDNFTDKLRINLHDVMESKLGIIK